MSDRGLPISDGAPACPFVAFAEDRDERATNPDHRHRCYAESPPAPRALAHQEAYCLSSAFPVCPTFQDWARREAARARETAHASASPSESTGPGTDHDPAALGRGPSSERNPPRDWAAPPPWMGEDGESGEDGDDAGDVRPIARGGLAGSFADRVASGGERPAERVTRDAAAAVSAPSAAASGGDVEPMTSVPASPSATPSMPAPAPAGPDERGSRRRDGDGPDWEHPRRLEEFPPIRSRRLGEWPPISPVLIAFAALLLASAVLFALPGLLGFGGPGGGPAASPTSAGASPTPLASLEPTPVPEPTATIYVVQQGDTMSKIANRFGIPLQALIDANAQNIPDPNRLQIGDQVIIPAATPTEIPAEVPAGS